MPDEYVIVTPTVFRETRIRVAFAPFIPSPKVWNGLNAPAPKAMFVKFTYLFVTKAFSK